MTNIFIIVAVLVIFFALIKKYILKEQDAKLISYRKKAALLNANEVAFFNALKAAVGDKGVVCTKVNLSSVVIPNGVRGKKHWLIANNRIAKSYFDFVVCDPRTLEVRVALELDDGRSLERGKIEREKLLLQVCKSANIPLIGASVKYSYQVSRLRRLLATHIDLIEVEKEVRFCRKCGSPMVIKTATHGEFSGRRFFTCSRQPQCTYTENYNVIFDTPQEHQENEPNISTLMD